MLNMNNIEQKNTNSLWFFDSITSWLKELMDKITWWINNLLVKLWLKKQEEIKQESTKTNKELSELMSEINQNVEEDEKLSEEEKLLINQNEDTKNYYKWLTDTFWEDIANRESEILLLQIKEKTKDNDLNNDETNKIQTYISDQKTKIEADDNLQKIIKDFPSIKNQKNWSTIQEIITAYEEVKWEDEEKEPTQEEVLERLNKK